MIKRIIFFKYETGTTQGILKIFEMLKRIFFLIDIYTSQTMMQHISNCIPSYRYLEYIPVFMESPAITLKL